MIELTLTDEAASGMIFEAVARLSSKYVVMEDECWLWKTTGSDYPTFQFEGRIQKAHRVAYRLFVGEIPKGMVLDHLCGEPRCVNPEHLEPVTHAENVRRGRATRLTRADAEAIRAKLAPIFAELETKYGVGADHLYRIATGQSWRDE